MSSKDLPGAEKPAEKAKAEPKPRLVNAGESGDPDVHRLLAERNTAASNEDEAAVKAVDKQLAELGYTAV